MRYASIRKLDTTNGKGIGVALFVQGCHFHCKDCFNESTWDFNGGKEFTNEDMERILKYLSAPYVTRFSILGGEPLCNENIGTVISIIDKVREKFPNIKIWLWTGYEMDFEQNNVIQMVFDNVNLMEESFRRLAASKVDILVDGRFKVEQKDLSLHYCGSKNQRVIDMKKTQKEGKVILYDEH